MINRDKGDSNEINRQVGKICVLLNLFPEGEQLERESRFEFILMNEAKKQSHRWKNPELGSLIWDHGKACQDGDFVKRVTALNQIAGFIEDMPGNRTFYYVEKAAILKHLANIMQLASVTEQKDKETPRQFVNLLETLANTITAKSGKEKEVLDVLKELSDYITARIETRKDKSELDVYKECIKEINVRFETQYSVALMNLESALLSYKKYLEGFKSTDPKITERIKECGALIEHSKDKKIDALTRVVLLSKGLEKMDTKLTLQSGGKSISVNKCSEHDNGSFPSAFNQLLDIIGKYFPKALQYKKGISQTLLHANVTEDVRNSIKPR